MTTLKLRADTEKAFYLAISQEFVDLLRVVQKQHDGAVPAELAEQWRAQVISNIEANADVLEEIAEQEEDAGSEDYLVIYAAQDYLDFGNLRVKQEA